MIRAELLKNRDYTFILSRKALITDLTHPGLMKQWRIAEKSVIAIAQACESVDYDGLTVYLATQPCQKFVHATSDTLAELFTQFYAAPEPDLYSALQNAIADHWQQQKNGQSQSNGAMIVVILDSEPNQRRLIVKLLVEASQKAEKDHSLGIMFAQVGEDSLLKGFLQSLDDDLAIAGAGRDIVDTKILGKLDPDQIEQFLLNAIFD